MDKSLDEQLVAYQSNVLPALLELLAKQLRVSTESLTALEIGYALHNRCWVIPERDEYGDVIGLSYRQWDGRKYMVSGSKRGLIYVPGVHRGLATTGEYQAGPHNWVRCSTDVPCPICEHTDWCMVSAEQPDDPRAVLCGRVSEGSVRSLGAAGYLHIRKTGGKLSQAGAVLPASDHPILIVEGATDVAAAYGIGLVAIGRPSATGCLDKLTSLVAGRSVVVLGENDAGAGQEGMDKTFEVLQPHAGHIVKMLPPEGIKDLRQWVAQGLTRERLLPLIQTTAISTEDQTILPSVAPLDLARQWLEATYWQDGIFTLRVFHEGWYAYNGQCYKKITRNTLRQQLYRFFGGKQFKRIRATGFDLMNYDPTKQKLDQIMDALLAFCPLTSEEIPCWLTKNSSNPKHILVFPNGHLDISGFARGEENFRLTRPSPHFFSLACYPYGFNPAATCGLWEEFLTEIFADDLSKIVLLQEWFGYNLIPDNSQEKFMLFLGPTRAGKSTILDVLTYILGDDQVVAAELRRLTQRFTIVSFLGKLSAQIGDVSVGSNYDAGEALNTLKRITGNDIITIERKGKDITETSVKLYTRFTMAANSMPHLPDYARTIESRMLIIQFLKSFAGREDTTLKTRLKMEAPGILLWSLKGLKRLQQNRDFTLPGDHGRVLQHIRGEITPLTEFMADCCELGSGADYWVTTAHLYACWRKWAVDEGEKVYTVGWLGRRLLTLYPSCTRTRRGTKERRVRVFLGLRIRSDVMKEMGLKWKHSPA